MTYQEQTFVPLEMRDSHKVSAHTSYQPLMRETDASREASPKVDTGSESPELWNAIKTVKDYVLSTGHQLIDTITGLCKAPSPKKKGFRGTAPEQFGHTNHSSGSSVLKSDTFRDVSTELWRKCPESEDTASWVKSMLSDPDVSGETKLMICSMVQLGFREQVRSVDTNLFGEQHRLMPRRSLLSAPRYTPYGLRQNSPGITRWEKARKVSGLPPLLPSRCLSGSITELRDVTPHRQEMWPYDNRTRSTSRRSSRRGSANFYGLGSSFSVSDAEMEVRSQTGESGLSQRSNRRGFVTCSDPAIAQALENYRRGRSPYTKEYFDKYNRVRRSQYVGFRSRLELSSTNKSKAEKRKSYEKRYKPSNASGAKRSRSEGKKEERLRVTMDTDSVNSGLETDTCSTVTILSQPPIVKGDSIHLNASSKDDDLKNGTFSGIMPGEPTKPISKTELDEGKAKTSDSLAADPKPSKANLFKSSKAKKDKEVSIKQIDNTKTASAVKAKVVPAENVSFACRMAQMRRIKIKEHYSQRIEKLYDCHCKDKDKDAKKKKAVETYEKKYHLLRQDHMFYTKLCEKYKVEPGNEYDGKDPDIKPDEEEADEKKSEATKAPEDKPVPSLFDIAPATNVKSTNNIFANAKGPASLKGFNFSGKLFSQDTAKSLNGQEKNSNIFSGNIISSIPSKSLFGKPNQKGGKPAPFTFGISKPPGKVSKASTKAEKLAEAKKIRLMANEVFQGCDTNALWAHHLEGTMPNSEDGDKPEKDGEIVNKPELGASSSTDPEKTSLHSEKKTTGNLFSGESNSGFNIPKPTSTSPFNLFSNPKSAGGGLFAMPATNGSSNNSNAGLFSGTPVSGTNMFDVKSDSSTNPFANSGSASKSETTNIFTTKSISKGPSSLFSSQSLPNSIFSSSSNGVFSTNNTKDSVFNVNNNKQKSEPKFSFGKVKAKSKTNGKRRRVVRGRRTMK